jgi:hypothetical protein
MSTEKKFRIKSEEWRKKEDSLNEENAQLVNLIKDLGDEIKTGYY